MSWEFDGQLICHLLGNAKGPQFKSRWGGAPWPCGVIGL